MYNFVIADALLMEPHHAVAALLLSSFLWTACSPAEKQKVTVGSKDFPEQVLLREIVAKLLACRFGDKIDVAQSPFMDTLAAHRALMNGSIDVYPEYTGTALTMILKHAWTRNRN